MGRERYTTAQVIKAIRDTLGIKTAIATNLKCTRQTIDNYISRHPTVAAAYWAERERLIDMAEAKFAEQIKDGEWPAIRFCLSTLGKDRGYVQKQEIGISGEIEIEQQVVWGEAKPED